MFGLKHIALFGAIVALVACAPRGSHISFGIGGSIPDHLEQRYQNDLAQRPVVISGLCMSACIILAASPYACLMPNTVLSSHGVWLSDDNDRNNRVVADWLPAKFQDYYLNHIVPNTGPNRFIKITYSEALDYGFKGCK